jgi:hypothetical protein
VAASGNYRAGDVDDELEVFEVDALDEGGEAGS